MLARIYLPAIMCKTGTLWCWSLEACMLHQSHKMNMHPTREEHRHHDPLERWHPSHPFTIIGHIEGETWIATVELEQQLWIRDFYPFIQLHFFTFLERKRAPTTAQFWTIFASTQSSPQLVFKLCNLPANFNFMMHRFIWHFPFYQTELCIPSTKSNWTKFSPSLQVREVFLDPITSLEQNEEGISSGFVLMMYQTTAVWMRANAHGVGVGRTTAQEEEEVRKKSLALFCNGANFVRYCICCSWTTSYIIILTRINKSRPVTYLSIHLSVTIDSILPSIFRKLVPLLEYHSL